MTFLDLRLLALKWHSFKLFRMHLRLVVVMAISIFFTNSLHASREANCSPVDLRSKMGPIRNQDGVGWCYSFAAADMLTFKNGGSPRVSAADLAAQYIDVSPQYQSRTNNMWLSHKNLNGGHIYSALQLAEKNGTCDETKIPSEINGGPQIAQAYRDLYASAYYRNDPKHKSLCAAQASKYRKFFPATSPTEILAVLNTEPPWRVVHKLFGMNCQQRRPAGISPGEIGLARKPDIGKVLNQELEQGQPVGIGYNIELITARKNANNGFGMHGSTIVGRKFDAKTGNCQYLLRNTWGRSCDGYRGWKCEAGHLWVNEDALLWATDSATYFK